MSDVFLSYSRRNSAFARLLIDRLTLLSKDAWVDWEGIPLTSPNWWAEIKAGMEGADSFVFILSPDSMASVVCNMELGYAFDLNKRIVPVLLQEVSSRDAFASIADFMPDEAMEERLNGQDPLVIARDNWQRLSDINWVFFREEDDFDTAIAALIATVETDLHYVKAHTRYLVRAKEWERENRRADLLLFGAEIDRAEGWQDEAEALAADAASNRSTNNPLPVDLHREYIRASRQADHHRRRLVRSAQVAIAALSGMLIIGLFIAVSIIHEAERQASAIEATSDVVNKRIVMALATMTQSAIVEDILTGLTNAQLMHTLRPATARTLMDELIDTYSYEPFAWHSRALFYSSLGDLEGAIADYDEAIRLNPAFARAYYNRGLSKASLGDLEGAIADYDEAIRLAPDFMVAYNTRGSTKSDVGDLEGAIADHNEALRLDSGYARAYYDRGRAKYLLGDLEGAIADYDEAIRLDPNFASAYVVRGIGKSSLGNTEGAIADYDEAIRLHPDDAAAYYNRGTAKMELGDFGEAIVDYDEAIRLDPNFASAYVARGIGKSSLGNTEGAIADYDEAIRLHPDDAATYYTRGTAKTELGDFGEAIVDYDAAIRLNSGFAAAYGNRGLSKARLGDLERAIADYDEAIRLNPTDPISYNNRGVAKNSLGDLEGAIADYDEALRLDPSHALAYYNRGDAYYRRAIDGATESREPDLLQALSDWREAERLGYTLPLPAQDVVREIELELGLTLTPMPTPIPTAADSDGG